MARGLLGNREKGLRVAVFEDPDLILTDIRMFALDGLVFLDRYRGNGGQAPVVVMTAHGGLELAVDAIHGGGGRALPVGPLLPPGRDGPGLPALRDRLED